MQKNEFYDSKGCSRAYSKCREPLSAFGRGRGTEAGDDEDDGGDPGLRKAHGAEDGGGHAPHDKDRHAPRARQRSGNKQEQGEQDEKDGFFLSVETLKALAAA